MSSINSHSLLRRAHGELDEASRRSTPQEQFLGAHMAALKGAAAVLAIAVPPGQSKRRRLRSAWVQLEELGEQWHPWVVYYEASARTRAALSSGLVRGVESDQAQDALRVTGRFLASVEEFVNRFEDDFTGLAQAS